MIYRGVERVDTRIRLLGRTAGDDGELMDWRDAERLALQLMHSAHTARDRELHQAGLQPGPTIEDAAA